jgi:nickel-dependent lactate racemase
LQVIFPERFDNLLKRGKKNKNILNLLACGALSSRPQSKEDLKKIASKYVFLPSDIKAKS